MNKIDLAQLQFLMVRVAIQGVKLPGLDCDLDFPDLATLREAEIKYVSSDHLIQPDMLTDLAETLPEAEVSKKAAELGPLYFLRFQQPSVQDNQISLSLQLVIGFDDVEPLALGAIVATFERGNGEWTAVEPTYVLAY
ncbi:hypothetical protein [Vibrio sp. EA2]|uniref:hypothetical protein n=1 Tax=Vibrio sp. EA2 TaxID=3079860 RepID=UPI0029495C02|nr:hypothetical protein [Vibrio sp. EA2]MDV6251949.1 hypothetical protein [Vibrio sp. EA2]